jgi:hypothetical protein
MNGKFIAQQTQITTVDRMYWDFEILKVEALNLYGNIPTMRQQIKQGYIKEWKSVA